jgi:hypothetical protein
MEVRTKYYEVDQIKEVEIGAECSTRGKEK